MHKVIVTFFFCLICLVIFSRCQRAPAPGFSFGLPFKRVSAEEENFYNAVILGTVEKIEPFLQAGHDPNFMNAARAIPWHDNNPLWSVWGNYEKTQLFIKYGADVRMRPYVWNTSTSTPILSNKYPNEKLLENIRTRSEDEVYNLVKLLLEAGADPNLKGYQGFAPFSFNKEKAYKKYFEENGFLPIEVPIKFSAFDVVDLLLEHGALLDASCVEAAKDATVRTGNDGMEKYIQTIWERQQKLVTETN